MGFDIRMLAVAVIAVFASTVIATSAGPKGSVLSAGPCATNGDCPPNWHCQGGPVHGTCVDWRDSTGVSVQGDVDATTLIVLMVAGLIAVITALACCASRERERNHTHTTPVEVLRIDTNTGLDVIPNNNNDPPTPTALYSGNRSGNTPSPMRPLLHNGHVPGLVRLDSATNSPTGNGMIPETPPPSYRGVMDNNLPPQNPDANNGARVLCRVCGSATCRDPHANNNTNGRVTSTQQQRFSIDAAPRGDERNAYAPSSRQSRQAQEAWLRSAGGGACPYVRNPPPQRQLTPPPAVIVRQNYGNNRDDDLQPPPTPPPIGENEAPPMYALATYDDEATNNTTSANNRRAEAVESNASGTRAAPVLRHERLRSQASFERDMGQAFGDDGNLSPRMENEDNQAAEAGGSALVHWSDDD